MPKKKTTEQFIKNAIAVHGQRYRYDFVVYSRNSVKVYILCLTHGPFLQTPSSHLMGSGCPDCGLISRSNKRRKPPSVFPKEAKEIHGDFYDYSLVEYVNCNTKVIIVCPLHGEFPQKPVKHLAGQGCPDCGDTRGAGKNRKPLDEFIKEAKEKHGDYDYSLVIEYPKNNKTKVTIICPRHGKFHQSPNSHLRGSGCPDCGDVTTANKRRKPPADFHKEARAKHGEFYDYSLVEYVNNHTKVTIVCPLHGEFLQAPADHLGGHGCSDCGDIITADNRRKPLDELIKEAKEVHGDYYDYSIVEYVNTMTPVTIICPQHGEFPQRPLNHIQLRQGCPECGDENLRIRRLEARIAKWRKIGSDLRNK